MQLSRKLLFDFWTVYLYLVPQVDTKIWDKIKIFSNYIKYLFSILLYANSDNSTFNSRLLIKSSFIQLFNRVVSCYLTFEPHIYIVFFKLTQRYETRSKFFQIILNAYSAYRSMLTPTAHLIRLLNRHLFSYSIPKSFLFLFFIQFFVRK